jgi:hypothetical protein
MSRIFRKFVLKFYKKHLIVEDIENSRFVAGVIPVVVKNLIECCGKVLLEH